MAIRNIVKVGDDVLRERSREVTEFDERLGILIDDLIETMIAAPGVGLAAPQVGVLKRVAVVSVKEGEVFELVNPKIQKCSGKDLSIEGCLSVPKVQGSVERPKRVTVSAFDRNGKQFTLKATDYLARAICHEIDHLDGILFTDKIVKDD